MNKVCKEYISDAKKFFPVMGKDERNYLRGLNGELEDFCEDNNISSKQELFEQYCQPYEIANDYYESVDTEKIIKKIRISKYIKILVSILILAAVIITTIFVVDFVQTHYSYSREEIVVSKILDENYINSTDETLYDSIQSDNFINDNDGNEIIE